MFDEVAVRETEQVQRLARDDDAGLVDSIPTKTHGSPLLVGDEILYRHVYTFVPTRCLHDLSKAVGASNLLLAQALMIHVLRGDHRRDQIESTNVEDLDDLRVRASASVTVPPYLRTVRSYRSALGHLGRL
jgi:hypothetical protein